MKQKAFIFILALAILSFVLAAYAGNKQQNSGLLQSSIFAYANLLLVSGFCWGSLVQGFLMWGPASIIQRFRATTFAVTALVLVYVVALPPVILFNTGPVPDDLASWLMAAMGAILGIMLILLIWLLQRLLSART